MADSTPERDKVAKEVIAWASISYAFGFAIVTIHTWRLGLPVIELLNQVYVWVGMPLAAVCFFAWKLLAIARDRTRSVSVELQEAVSQLGRSPTSADYRKVEHGFSSAGLLGSYVAWLLARHRKRLEQEQQRATDQSSVQSDATARWASSAVAFAKGVLAIRTLTEFLRGIVAVGFLLGLYVWVGYPSLSQSLGGGKPTVVTVVVEADALAEGLANAQVTDPPPKTRTLQARLLYRTADAVHLELEAGRRVSIASKSVRAIVWPTDGQRDWWEL
ncbi:MAG: hypothetical protein AAFX85_10190 [Pseudomonadota bacterium]